MADDGGIPGPFSGVGMIFSPRSSARYTRLRALPGATESVRLQVQGYLTSQFGMTRVSSGPCQQIKLPNLSIAF